MKKTASFRPQQNWKWNTCSTSICLLFAFFACRVQAYDVDYASRLGTTGILGENLTTPTHSSDYYNIKAGPFDLSFTAGLDLTYNDNIGLSKNNRLNDFILTPNLDMEAVWPMTEHNTLRIGVGLGYSKYLIHTEADSKSPILTTGSNTGVDFDVLAGDFRFTFFDHISYEQDPIGNGNLSNTLNFGRFVNDAGVRGTWNLNDLQLAMSISQENWISSESTFSYLDRSSQIISATATYQLGPATFAGIQASTALTAYDQHVQNNNMRYSVGPFMRNRLTKYLDFNCGAALEVGDFSTGGSNGDTSNLSSYSLYAGLTHRLNRYVSHSLTAERAIELGTYTNYVETWRITHSASWNVFNNVSLGTHLFAEFGEESGSITTPGSIGYGGGDSYTRYGGGLSLGYRFTEHLTSSLGYNYIEKICDRLSDRDYYQNTVTLDFRYNF